MFPYNYATIKGGGEKIDLEETGNIFIAKDTRSSSPHLSELVREGALLVGGNVLDFGLQTTPQLHHYVRMWNYEKYNKGDWASEAGYYNMMVDAFKQLTSGVDFKERSKLVVDCAHGVGAPQLAKLAKEIQPLLQIELRNTVEDGGELNFECGAEHAQKARKHPHGFSADADRDVRCCSFDGDADRVVYHYFDSNGQWHLLDGDKIATLIADFFVTNLASLPANNLKLGLVQTAYANGSSTAFLEKKNISIGLAKTGVKFCHHKALEYDIGIYFEANGHGTVLFKDAALQQLHDLENTVTEEKAKLALNRLLAAAQLINQAVGDAISDMLLVEALLILQNNQSVAEWDSCYSDLCSRQTKLQVKDRHVLVVNESETKVIKPVELKDLMDQIGSDEGRAFVRASGTEDVVRIYAESSSQEKADDLAMKVANYVYEHAGGVGDKPTSFIA